MSTQSLAAPRNIEFPTPDAVRRSTHSTTHASAPNSTQPAPANSCKLRPINSPTPVAAPHSARPALATSHNRRATRTIAAPPRPATRCTHKEHA